MRRLAKFFMQALVIAMAVSGAPRADQTIEFDYHGVIAAGDQEFKSGRLTLVKVSRSPYVRLCVDGRVAATYFLASEGHQPLGTSIYLVLERDANGVARLVALRRSVSGTDASRDIPLQLAKVSHDPVIARRFRPDADETVTVAGAGR